MPLCKHCGVDTHQKYRPAHVAVGQCLAAIHAEIHVLHVEHEARLLMLTKRRDELLGLRASGLCRSDWESGEAGGAL